MHAVRDYSTVTSGIFHQEKPKVISPQMRSHLKCDGQLRWIFGVMRCDGVTRMTPNPAAPPHMKN